MQYAVHAHFVLVLVPGSLKSKQAYVSYRWTDCWTIDRPSPSIFSPTVPRHRLIFIETLEA